MKGLRTVLCIALMLTLLAGSLFAEAKNKVQKTYLVDRNKKLKVINDNGSVKVSTWDEDHMKITATKLSWSWKGKEELDKVDIDVTEDEDSILVQTNFDLEKEKVFVFLTIKIPEFILVDKVESFNGALTIKESIGDIVLETGSGRIEVIEVTGNVSAKTHNGGILIESVNGNCVAETSLGTIEVVDSSGDMTLKTSSGRIKIENSQGNMTAELKLGDIDVDDLEGVFIGETSVGSIKIVDSSADVDAKTAFGKISLTNIHGGKIKAESEKGKIEIEECAYIIKAETINGNIIAEIYNIPDEGTTFKSEKGDIELDIAEKLNADVEIKNIRGKIKIRDNVFEPDKKTDNEQTGKIGEGGGKLYVKTRNGDIELEELW